MIDAFKAVFWSFFGVRKRRHMQQDMTIKPLHVVIFGLLGGLVFVLTLVGGNERMNAARAQALGLVGEVVPPDRLLARAFEVAYPAEFRNPKYAGRTVAFEVKVGGVREKKLPEMDDAFAKQFGDVTGVDELKGKVRERLVAEGEEHSRRQAEEMLRKALAERNPFDVPATLVKRQTIAMMQDTFERLASQGVDLKKMNMDVDKMSERFAPNAERMVRVSLLIDAIARKENIEASFSEIDAEMKAMAEAQGMEYGKVREMYSSEERMDALRDRLLERKVIGFLMDNAEVTEGAPE